MTIGFFNYNIFQDGASFIEYVKKMLITITIQFLSLLGK
jgi:hypothetical protein